MCRLLRHKISDYHSYHQSSITRSKQIDQISQSGKFSIETVINCGLCKHFKYKLRFIPQLYCLKSSLGSIALRNSWYRCWLHEPPIALGCAATHFAFIFHVALQRELLKCFGSLNNPLLIYLSTQTTIHIWQ